VTENENKKLLLSYRLNKLKEMINADESKQNMNQLIDIIMEDVYN